VAAMERGGGEKKGMESPFLEREGVETGALREEKASMPKSSLRRDEKRKKAIHLPLLARGKRCGATRLSEEEEPE